MDKAEEKGSYVFTVQEMKEVGKGMKLTVGDFNNFIGELNHKGNFLKRGAALYEFIP